MQCWLMMIFLIAIKSCCNANRKGPLCNKLNLINNLSKYEKIVRLVAIDYGV